MKQYYFKKNETELSRLKRDLAFYAEIQRYTFQLVDDKQGYVCQFKKSKNAVKAITLVIRESLTNAITIQIGCVNWIDKDNLINSFFPELNSKNLESLSVRLLDKAEREIRHDIKMISKIRLGSYFNQRSDAE